MFSLKKVFERSDKQKVWYKVTQIEETDNYNVFFVAQRTEVNSPFLCVRVMCTPELTLEFFTKPEGMQELKLKDSELAAITLTSGAFQYWYVASSAAANAEDATTKVVEHEKKEVGYYEVTDRKTTVTHLEFSVFSDMFEASDSMLLNRKELIEEILIENGKAERKDDDREWKPEDGPTSYKALLLRLIRAEALRAMSARHPGFVTELPFAYGNFHEGYPVVFCKQDDIFFGTIDNVGITHSEAGGRTLASISGIVSIRDALKLSSVSLKQLSGEIGSTLGFDFVNPLAVNLGTDRKFDWRRCAVIDQNKIDSRLPSMEVKLSDVLGLEKYDQDWWMETALKVPGAYEFMVNNMRTGHHFYYQLYQTVQAGTFKKALITSALVASWEPFIHFDEKLFDEEIYSIYTARLAARLNNEVNAPVIERLNEIARELKSIWNESPSVFDITGDKIPEWSYSSSLTDLGMNVTSEIQDEWDTLKQEYDILLPSIFTDMPGVLDKETEWLYRIIPACIGLSEASEYDYEDLLIPRQMFSDFPGDDWVYTETEDPGILASGLLAPLPRAVLKKGASVYSAAVAIVRFIDNVREHVKPYIIRKNIEDPEDTINVMGGRDG